MAPMGLDSPIAGRVGEKHFFFRIAAIQFEGSRGSPPRTREFCGGYAPPDPAVQVLWGLPAPTPRGSLLDAQK